MRPVVDFFDLPDRKLRVALRRREPLVAKQFLNRTQVRPFFEHMRSEGVPQCMRMHLCRKPVRNGQRLYDAAHAPRREASAATQVLAFSSNASDFLPAVCSRASRCGR